MLEPGTAIPGLQLQIPGIHQRAGQQLGEHHDLLGIGCQTAVRENPLAVYIDYVGSDLEQEKADARRQISATLIDLKEHKHTGQDSEQYTQQHFASALGKEF